MTSASNPFAETLSRILATHHESRDRSGWPSALWHEIEGAGFPMAMLPEEQGGASMRWDEVWPLLSLVGKTAAPVPLAESIIARWLTASAGLRPGAGLELMAVPRAPLALLATDGVQACRITGTLPRVPWGRYADALVTLAETDGVARVVRIPITGADTAATVQLTHGCSISAEPRDAVTLLDARAEIGTKVSMSQQDLLALAAAARSAQIAGAMCAALELTIAHTRLRVQFGRPLSGFQAIQQHLARFAAQTAAAMAASQMALEAVDQCLNMDCAKGSSVLAGSLHVCAGKIRAGEAAGIGAAIAHQVFGAIGFTSEHPLHQLTTRLYTWRDEYGNETFWSRHVGQAIVATGPHGLWSRITHSDSGIDAADAAVQGARS